MPKTLSTKRASVPEISQRFSKFNQTSTNEIEQMKPLPFDFKEDYLRKNFNMKNRRRSPKLGNSGEPLSVMRDIRISSRVEDTDVEALS